MIVEFRKYQSVPAYTAVNHDYTPSPNERLYLERIGGTAIPSDPHVIVKIIMDPNGDNELLLATNSESDQQTARKLIGDGVKVMRIVLDNQTSTSKIMGGFFFGSN